MNRQQRKNYEDQIAVKDFEILRLKTSLEEKNRMIDELGKVPKIDYDVNEPSPTNAPERREYVARVAGFFEDVLAPKLKHMISLQQQELSNPLRSRESDLITKGTINALSLMLDWGEDMVNERLADSTNNKQEENG